MSLGRDWERVRFDACANMYIYRHLGIICATVSIDVLDSLSVFSMAKLDQQDCREAIIQFASENCCYGSKPAREMQINKFEGITALHVRKKFCTVARYGCFRSSLQN